MQIATELDKSQQIEAENCNIDKLVGKYAVLWVDQEVENDENKGYREQLNLFSYC